MLRWQVGTVEVFRIDASNFVLPSPVPMPSWAVPWLTPSVSEAPVAFSALALRSGDQRIVVDPWLADDGPRSRPDATVIIDGLLAELAEVGFPAERVDVVVNTHIDGIGWNTRPAGDGWVPTFPRARYLFPAAELEALDRGVRIAGGDELGPLRDAGVLDAIELPYVLTPEVMLEAAPGHNYGHAAVRIESRGDLAVYPGHLVLSLLQIDSPERNVGELGLVTATATRRRVLGELADRRGLLLTTLIGGPGAGTVARTAAGFRLAPHTIASAGDARPEC
jgi:glyoxylase-like metal-dependent hydrolase (beta-lactamase superfamily II)